MPTLRIPVVVVGARRTSKGCRTKRKHWFDLDELPAGVADALLKVDVQSVVIHMRDGRSVVFENPDAFRERMALKGREDFA